MMMKLTGASKSSSAGPDLGVYLSVYYPQLTARYERIGEALVDKIFSGRLHWTAQTRALLGDHVPFDAPVPSDQSLWSIVFEEYLNYISECLLHYRSVGSLDERGKLFIESYNVWLANARLEDNLAPVMLELIDIVKLEHAYDPEARPEPPTLDPIDRMFADAVINSAPILTPDRTDMARLAVMACARSAASAMTRTGRGRSRAHVIEDDPEIADDPAPKIRSSQLVGTDGESSRPPTPTPSRRSSPTPQNSWVSDESEALRRHPAYPQEEYVDFQSEGYFTRYRRVPPLSYARGDPSNPFRLP
jgi:hypothetical protein